MDLYHEPLKVSKRKIQSLITNAVGSAKAVNLVYVSDKQAGISRIKKSDTFCYKLNGRQIRNRHEISRIEKLVIPPAWEQVWICPHANGHIQATGIDTRGRKQYRYHNLWSALRKETKFVHMHDFGKALPAIRKKLKEDLALKGLPQQKVLAIVVSLMNMTGIRVGCSFYEKTYGSYGITTLKDKHVDIQRDEIKFSFRGKKGVEQRLALRSKKLAKLVQQCKDIPGKELFQYYDEHGQRRPVDSGMVNSYIKDICGKEFTSKDFRTWLGTVCALEHFLQSAPCCSSRQANKKVVEILDAVASRLGNTRAVCKKYYVHPMVVDHYLSNSIEKYSKVAAALNSDEEFSHEEAILMTMLEGVGEVVIAA